MIFSFDFLEHLGQANTRPLSKFMFSKINGREYVVFVYDKGYEEEPEDGSLQELSDLSDE